MDDPKDEFDQLHPIKMLFLNALVSEGRPTETRHMPRWWNLEFVSVNGIFLITKCEKSLKINNFDWWFSTHTQGSTDHQPRGRLNRTEPDRTVWSRTIVDQKSNNSKISSKMNKCFVFELFKKNSAREFCWEFMVKNDEIFLWNFLWKFNKKTKQSKFQSTK